MTGGVVRATLVTLAVISLVVLGFVWWANRPPRGPEPGRGEPPDFPDVRFVDITSQAGIDFVHTSGARGEKLLPETMGSGAAFFDYDGDGDQDLLLVNAERWPDDPDPRPQPTQALYRNDGHGHFEDVTAAAGLDVSMYGTGVAVGDYDGDGDEDVYITALGENKLFRNDGGHFTDVTRAAGVGGDPSAWSTSAGFLDYDGDGDLDLFVCNYVKWTKAIDLELNFTLNGRDRAFGPPTNYEGLHPYLFRQDADGKFTDVSAKAGIDIDNPATGLPAGKALGVAIADLDGDGFPEILVANDTTQNFLFHNRRDGTFEEIGSRAGVGYDASGKTTGAMGIDVGRFLDDDRMAVAIGNFANETSSFYVARGGKLSFTDEAEVRGIGPATLKVLSFGLFFFDYDLDGRLDLLQVNGHLENEIHQVQVDQQYRQPAQLFWNTGDTTGATYAMVPEDLTGDLARPLVGRGAAYADIDGDGDLDVIVTQAGGRPLLLRNDQRLGHHWVRVVLEGTRSNRDGIGAWVELKAGGRVQMRQVMPTRSYLSQVEMPVTFGLGDARIADEIIVRWPDGLVQHLSPVEIDATLRIVEPGTRPAKH